jgi:galactokinase
MFPIMLQALPMVTLLVGRKSGTDTCRIVTTVTETDEPRRVEFAVPSKQTILPGIPRWANYVKGVIANFHANGKTKLK